MKNVKKTKGDAVKVSRGLKGSTARANAEFLLLVLPGALLCIAFHYLPMFGLTVAFKNINYIDGVFGSPWCGIQNFKFLFGYPDLWGVVRNTLLYQGGFLILGMIVPVASAIGMSQMTNKKTTKVYQTIMMLPHFISWVVISYLVLAFLDYKTGLVNTMGAQMFGMKPHDWYADTKFWPYLTVFLNQWKSIGYNSVVYIAAIAGIDTGLYEAAAIDGAKKRQQIWYITVPELLNIVIIMTILSIGTLVTGDFGLFYNVPKESGALMPVTNVISTFIYRTLKVNSDIGMSSAASFLQSVISLILVVGSNMIVKMIDEERSLF